jgi:hypothetical protein
MVPVVSLWLPILLSAVLVFVVSSILHMVLPFHRSDFQGVPAEDRLREAMNGIGVPPGDYMVPHASGSAEMKSPEFQTKWKEGPVALLTVIPPGPPTMAASLVQWFLYALVVSVFAAYVAGRAVPAGGDYLEVFRFAGVMAFAGYALALWQGNIWYKRSWATTVKSNIDGLIYACLTGGAFGWLWPAA